MKNLGGLQQSVGFVLWGTGNSVVFCFIAVGISVNHSGEPPPTNNNKKSFYLFNLTIILRTKLKTGVAASAGFYLLSGPQSVV